jgi:chromosome segregation ATPase
MTRVLLSTVFRKSCRVLLPALGLALVVSYALVGDDLKVRTGAWFHDTARYVSDVAETRRLEGLASQTQDARQALAELEKQHQVIEEQITALEGRRDEAASQLREDSAVLDAVVKVLAGIAEPKEGLPSREEVEEDTAEALQRVRARRTELQQYEATLARLSESRDDLGKRSAQARRLVNNQAKELQLQQARLEGQRAYFRGVEAVRQLRESERRWEKSSLSSER